MVDHYKCINIKQNTSEIFSNECSRQIKSIKSAGYTTSPWSKQHRAPRLIQFTFKLLNSVPPASDLNHKIIHTGGHLVQHFTLLKHPKNCEMTMLWMNCTVQSLSSFYKCSINFYTPIKGEMCLNACENCHSEMAVQCMWWSMWLLSFFVFSKTK